MQAKITKAKEENLPVIGANTLISVAGRENVPAKIDTGADSSSIWVSHLRIDKNGILKFRLFDEPSPFYSGKVIKRKDYKVAVIRSSNGQEQIRYRTYFPITLAGKKIRVLFSLSDRSNNNFPVLIGRRSISGKFLVDVSKSEIPRPPKNPKTTPLQAELEKNPREFYKKYTKTRKEGAGK